MSTTDPTQWPDLPLFHADRWVVTDDDIAVWSDITYMRTLVDELGILCARTGEAITDAGVIEHQVDAVLAPWPGDLVADMLAAWRASTGPGPARLPVERVPA